MLSRIIPVEVFNLLSYCNSPVVSLISSSRVNYKMLYKLSKDLERRGFGMLNFGGRGSVIVYGVSGWIWVLLNIDGFSI